MSPKEYLLQIQKLNSKIHQRRQQLSELKSTLYGLKGTGIGEKVQTSAAADAPFVRIFEKFETVESELSTLVDELVEKKNLIISQINSMENTNFLNLLYKRYVEGKRLNVVAEEMNYSYRHASRMHGWALVEFGKKFLKDVL